MSELDDIMEEVALANRVLYTTELCDSSTIERGHVSYRLPNQPDQFVIKALGPALSMVEAEHMVVVNTDEHVRWSRKGYAVVADDWKFINYSWTGSMLFDLKGDALEQRDLLATGEALSPEGQRHLRRVEALHLHDVVVDEVDAGLGKVDAVRADAHKDA